MVGKGAYINGRRSELTVLFVLRLELVLVLLMDRLIWISSRRELLLLLALVRGHAVVRGLLLLLRLLLVRRSSHVRRMLLVLSVLVRRRLLLLLVRRGRLSLCRIRLLRPATPHRGV